MTDDFFPTNLNKCFLNQIVKRFSRTGKPKLHTQQLYKTGRQTIPVRQTYVTLLQVSAQLNKTLLVHRKLFEILSVTLLHERKGAFVDFSGCPVQPRNAPKNKTLFQTFRVQTKIRGSTPTTITLTNRRPRFVGAHMSTNRFRIADDVISAEMLKVIRLLDGVSFGGKGLMADRRA